jgi:hypothetical protein
VHFELIDRVVEDRDVDAIALLCRWAGFERAIFVTLAIAFDDPEKRVSGAEEFGKLYESVPIHAAQRALRFWKARATETMGSVPEKRNVKTKDGCDFD